LRGREKELLAANARLLFVGTGSPAMAADFQKAHASPHPVFSDVTRRSFEAAGMRRSFWSFLHWRFVRNALRAFRNGFRQTEVLGDAWQQGGVLLFDSHGRLRHHQIDAVAGDTINLDAVVTALRSGVYG
jgi:hypothetical protein